MFWEKEKIRQKMKLIKFLLANSKRAGIQFFGGEKLASWIKEEIKKKSVGEVSIASDAVRKLATFVGAEIFFCLIEKWKN